MVNSEKSCCFTGHRKIPARMLDALTCNLENQLISLIENGVNFFYAGGAIGFDTIAAKMIISLRNKYPQIKLFLILPCISQSKNWSNEDKYTYEKIKVQSDYFTYTSEKYYRGCMFKRNRCLVDNSDICVCFLSEHTGGTAYTVKYAESKNLRIVNLALTN